MRSFKEYDKDLEKPTDEQERTLAENLTQKIAEAYNGKSDLEMLKNILAEAEKGKRNGTLSNAEIEQFYQTFLLYQLLLLELFQLKQLLVNLFAHYLK